MLTFYVQVVIHILEASSMEDVIAEENTKIVNFTQRTNMSPLRYLDSLSMKTLPGQHVLDEYVLNGTFWKAYCTRKGKAWARVEALTSMPHYRNWNMSPLLWQSYRRKLEKWINQSVISLLQQYSTPQVVRRIGDKVPSAWYCHQSVHNKQECTATLDEVPIVNTHGRPRIQSKEHHESSPRNLQMTCGIVICVYHSHINRENALSSGPTSRQNPRNWVSQPQEDAKATAGTLPELYATQMP